MSGSRNVKSLFTEEYIYIFTAKFYIFLNIWLNRHVMVTLNDHVAICPFSSNIFSPKSSNDFSCFSSGNDVMVISNDKFPHVYSLILKKLKLSMCNPRPRGEKCIQLWMTDILTLRQIILEINYIKMGCAPELKGLL